MSILYIVATPIGNLEDISLRAIRVLGSVDFILCEDTRVSHKLLNHYKINTPTISFHEHSNNNKYEKIIKLLSEGKNLALITDAGTPGISDPGGKLIEIVLKEFGEDIKIESIPGPSAITAALSISGIPTDKFVFMGFPPHKKGRNVFIEKIFKSEWPVVIYESKHRIIKFLEELRVFNEKINNNQLKEVKNEYFNYYQKKLSKLGEKNFRLTSIIVCREISKMHETIYRGSITEVISKIKNNSNNQKGEFVIIISK